MSDLVADEEDFDGRFSLPAVDDPPSTETGVILMGLDAERLLAGLGLATVTENPALIALAVDQLQHNVAALLSLDDLTATGASRWLSSQPELHRRGHGFTTSAAPRQAWTHAVRMVQTAELGEVGPASLTYLAACWLRRNDVDRQARQIAVSPR